MGFFLNFKLQFLSTDTPLLPPPYFTMISSWRNGPLEVSQLDHMLITNLSAQVCRIMRLCCAASRYRSSSAVMMYDQKIPMSPEVVCCYYLLPQLWSTEQIYSSERILRVNNITSDLTCAGNWQEIKFYFIKAAFLWQSNCDVTWILSLSVPPPPVRPGTHGWELHGSLRQRLPVVPAGWDTTGKIQAKLQQPEDPKQQQGTGGPPLSQQSLPKHNMGRPSCQTVLWTSGYLFSRQ